MIASLLWVIWFFLPAGIANATPIVVAKVPGLSQFNYPLDMNRTFRGKRIFGDHKTVRGVVSGVIVAIILVNIQKQMYADMGFIQAFVPLDYTALNSVIFGTLSGLGALLGDALKSFFKRQLDVPPGASWIPFDQLDYIVGGIVFTAFYVRLSLLEYVLLVMVWIILHPISSLLGYFLRLKSDPL